MKSGLIIDLFAGGGGASTGIEAAMGRPVDVAVNHSAVALAVHLANHPGTLHFVKDVFEVRPQDVVQGRPVQLLWASPDCTHFSLAKGDVPRDHGIRALAWVVVDWAREARPSIICLENVREFLTWGPLDETGRPNKARQGETFRQWVAALEAAGYVVDWRILDASEFGAPTRRKRLFVVARSDGQPITWPEPTHGPGLRPLRTAAEIIDWSIPCPSIFGRKRPLAEKTLERIAAGIDRFVIRGRPFIVGEGRAAAFLTKHFGGVTGQDLRQPIGTITARDHHSLTTAFLTAYYSSGSVGQDIDSPLRTITAKHRLGLVKIEGQDFQITDIGMRMLEPHELLAAQFGQYADGYDLSAATTKAAKIRLIGNSVCPDVARALVESQINPTQNKVQAAA